MLLNQNKYFINFIFLIFLFGISGNAQDSSFLSLKIDFQRLRNEGKQDSALVLVKKMNKLALNFEGDSSINFAISFRYIGNVYVSLNENDSAIFYFKKSLFYLNKKDLRYKVELATTLNKLGEVYFNIGKFSLAKLFLTKSLTIRKTTSSKRDLEYASNLNTLGNLYRDIGDYKKAKLFLQQSSDIIKNNLGDKHINYATILNNLGNLYSDLGDYISAETYLKKAYLILKPLQNNYSLDLGSTLNNLGNIYRIIGDYKNAKIFLSESEEILSKLEGNADFEYAGTLNNLGILFDDLSDHKSAEDYYKKALIQYKELYGENNAYYSAVLNNLGLLYSDIGNFEKAESLINKGLEIRRKILGEQHSDYASSLINLAIIFRIKEDFKKSLSYTKKALSIQANSLGNLHPSYAANLNTIANTYSDMANYSMALKYYKQAFEILKKVFGENNREVASSLSNIGLLYAQTGDYKLAESNLKKSLIINKKALGKYHPVYAENLYKLGRVYDLKKDTKKALDNYDSCFNIISNYIKNNFEWLSEREAELFWNQFDSYFNTIDYFSSTFNSSPLKAIELSYNSNLFSKGRLLAVKVNKNNSKFSNNDSINNVIGELYRRISFLKKYLAKIDSESDVIKYRKLNEIADSLDKTISFMWSGFSAQNSELSVTWKQVKDNLYSDEAAIEFIRYRSDTDSNYYYNALILTKTFQQPILVKLCSEKELLKIQPKLGFSAYYPLVWSPIDKYLNGIKKIFYSPIGVLNNVPFHALYSQRHGGDIIDKDFKFPITETGAFYLLNKYSLHRLSSTRLLALGLKEKALEKINKSIVLFGGIDYNYFPNLYIPKYDSSKSVVCGLQNDTFPYLESSKVEVQTINNKLKSVGWQTNLYEEFEANEDNFVKFQDDSARSVLHIATHGFVLPDSSKTFFDLSNSSLEYKLSHNYNPLKRSGLVMAGGNLAWTCSDLLKEEKIDLDYGVLTASKISELNLRETRLVVLSTCNSGLGKIQDKEGVYGLIRAFKLAGVDQLIVSLWEVPDNHTKELMTYFYEDFSITQNAIISFEKAQKIMEKKYPTRPDWWAAFVLIR